MDVSFEVHCSSIYMASCVAYIDAFRQLLREPRWCSASTLSRSLAHFVIVVSSVVFSLIL